MSILDQFQRPPATGPTSPYGPGFMPRHLQIPQYPSASTFPAATTPATFNPTSLFPRHLSIPNYGGSVPTTGTPVNFPTTNPLTRAPAGRLASGRLAQLGSSARTAVKSSPLARAGRFARGAGRFGRLGPALIAGLTAGPVGSAIGGQSEDTPGFDRRDVGQFTAGAMTGASLGSVASWPGAIVGGLVGGIGNATGLFDVFSGDDGEPTLPDNPSETLDDVMMRVGLGKETRDAIRETTFAQLELATTEAERAAVLQNADAVIQQEAMAQEAAQQQLAHSLALQAQAAQIFQPYAEANQRNADMARVLFENASEGLPESQRYLAAQFALGAQQQSDALTQQMMSSAVAQPRIDALVAQQQQIDNVAAQIVQQAMAQQMSGGAGGGAGVDIDALLAGV